MKNFTQKSVSAKVINSPEYQEYLEFLEEEAMSKNPDDFCFQKPDRTSYTADDYQVFQYMNDPEFEQVQLISAAI